LTKKFTDPVGVPEPVVGATVAVITTGPLDPATTEVGEIVNVVVVGATATVTVTAGDVEGASLAPSPLKQATTLGVPTPSWAPVIPDKEAAALQLVVQAVAGTRFADPNAVPLQDEPG
jgi:hypothetical protein